MTLVDQDDASRARQCNGLRVIGGAPEDRDPDAVDFLRASGLSLSNILLGLFDQSDDCIKMIDRDGRLQFMNCNGKQAMEVDDFSVIEGADWTTLWPDESRHLISKSVEVALSGGVSRFEAFCPTAKGTPRWWEVTVSPIRADDGSVAAILSSSRDVTDRKRREETLAIVAAEMKHRLRNAHTVGAALTMIAARHQPQHKPFAQDMSAKLSQLADLQAVMLDHSGVSLETLCKRSIMRVDSDSPVRIGALPALDLSVEGARTLSLVLSELTTNSVKHGALGRGGSVSLSGSIENGSLTLDWIETFEPNGDAAAASNEGGGQGTGLMQSMLALLGGTLDGGKAEHGYRTEIHVPLDRVRRTR